MVLKKKEIKIISPKNNLKNEKKKKKNYLFRLSFSIVTDCLYFFFLFPSVPFFPFRILWLLVEVQVSLILLCHNISLCSLSLLFQVSFILFQQKKKLFSGNYLVTFVPQFFDSPLTVTFFFFCFFVHNSVVRS